MTQQEQPARQPQTQKSKKARVLLVILAAVLVLSIAGMILGAAARHRRERTMQAAVVTCGEFEMTSRDLSYYYWSEYFYFANAVGSQLPGFDAGVAPDEQMYDETRTWQDYFLERTLITVRDTVSMTLAARAVGFELPEDYRASYERALAQFEQAAAEQGYDDVQAYLRASYGPDATIESFEAYLYDTHLAAAYSDELYETIEISSADAEAYRSLHETDYADCQTQDEALSEAAEDLRAEQYQNLFLSLTEPYQFEVNYDAITLYQPEGVFEQPS